MSKEVEINKGYEIYQIITDFGDPLEIFREALQNAYDEGATRIFCNVYEKTRISGNELVIDIWNNGEGLSKKNVGCFFDLANSSKIDENNMPIKGKIGYKGHGSKIFFNSKEVQICSKYKDEYWAVRLENPLQQIDMNKTLTYSDFLDPQSVELSLPENWDKGFRVRIISPYHFNTQHTLFKLNHKMLRDYIKWFTVFGTIQTLYDENLKNKNTVLYLSGLDIDNFSKEYQTIDKIDPLPEFTEVDAAKYEVIRLGHYFPDERYTEEKMKKYVKEINSNKPYYEYYSRIVYNDEVNCINNVRFRFVLCVEGYESKRRYDILLSKRGKQRTELTHTDSDRYGLWACKGGVPVEKIDDWIEGGKGTYTFMQAFVDFDDFQLTANRGSIRNSDIEKMEIIKKNINNILNNRDIKEQINERVEIEKMESQIASIEDDMNAIKLRANAFKKRKTIMLSDGTKLLEPTRNKTGYSESETMVLLINLMAHYPDLFPFKVLDYNTNKGIDFVVEDKGNYKYIELKGTLANKINHPFRCISKFICYDLGIEENSIVTDIENFETSLKINKNDDFASYDEKYKGKKYTSYQLIPNKAQIQSMEIMSLKKILIEVLNAKIE